MSVTSRSAYKPVNDIEEVKNLFPDIYEISGLSLDLSLTPVKILSIEKLGSQPIVTVNISVPSAKKADLYLCLNNKPFDMYYQISTGTYIFKNFFLPNGKYKFEVLYRIGTRKCKSVSLTIHIGGTS